PLRARVDPRGVPLRRACGRGPERVGGMSTRHRGGAAAPRLPADRVLHWIRAAAARVGPVAARPAELAVPATLDDRGIDGRGDRRPPLGRTVAADARASRPSRTRSGRPVPRAAPRSATTRLAHSPAPVGLLSGAGGAPRALGVLGSSAAGDPGTRDPP